MYFRINRRIEKWNCLDFNLVILNNFNIEIMNDIMNNMQVIAFEFDVKIIGIISDRNTDQMKLKFIKSHIFNHFSKIRIVLTKVVE